MMRTALLLVVLVACHSEPGHSPALAPVTAGAAAVQGLAPADVRRVGEAPAFGVVEAIDRAQRHAAAQRISFERQYLQAATFDFVARSWLLSWLTPNAKGGVTEIYVFESGKIEVRFGE